MGEYDYVSINGKQYRTVERKAKVGEMLLITYSPDFSPNTITKCVGIDGDYYRKDGSIFVEEQGLAGGYVDGSEDKYVVLEPLPEEVMVDQSQASEQVIEMFAALSRKIVSLESQLRDTQRNVERQAEELENAKHRIQKHADMFGIVEGRLELVIEDLIMLDGRTQVIDAITKFYEEARR